MTDDRRHADRRDPETPEGSFDLHAAARTLLDQAGDLDAGRSARTLTPRVGGPLKQTLMALRAGRRLAEHRAPGPATLQVLEGSVTLAAGDRTITLAAGEWAVIPDEIHDLSAQVDAVVLLTVALPTG